MLGDYDVDASVTRAEYALVDPARSAGRHAWTTRHHDCPCGRGQCTDLARQNRGVHHQSREVPYSHLVSGAEAALAGGAGARPLRINRVGTSLLKEGPFRPDVALAKAHPRRVTKERGCLMNQVPPMNRHTIRAINSLMLSRCPRNEGVTSTPSFRRITLRSFKR